MKKSDTGLRLASFFNQSGVAIFFKLLFWLGLALDIFIVIISPTILNIFIIILYIYLGFIRNIYWGDAKWGKVIDAAGKLQPFCSIKLFKKDSLGSNLAARTVSDERGRYFLIAEPGEYVLEAASASGLGEVTIAYKKDISVSDRSSIKETLVLE